MKLTVEIGTLVLFAQVCFGGFIKSLNENEVAFGLSPNFDHENIETLISSQQNLTDYKVGKHSLLALHEKLVRIPSISKNELAVAYYLQSFLTEAGLSVELQKLETHDDNEPIRYNVYAYLGETRNTTVLLTSHIDTVPPYREYRVEGSRIYGRGSTDAKGSVATQIFSFLSLVESGEIKEGDVALLYVVGEEVDGIGMLQVGKNLNTSWDSAIFGEPTENKLGVGHKGTYGFELNVRGKASHLGYPDLGISASEILIPVLQDLLELEFPVDELLGKSTLNIGKIDVGVANNVIPENGTANVFIRVASDIQEIDRLVHTVVDGVEHLTTDFTRSRGVTYLDYKVPGFESIVLAYSTDVPNLLTPVKFKYLYGPGSITVAHSDNEFVENQSLLDAIDGYIRLVRHSLAK